MPDYSKVETQAGAINAAIQKHNSSSSLMVETLESGLSQLRNQPVRISELQREVCPFVSRDRKSTRLNSSHITSSYAVFCLKIKNYLDLPGPSALSSSITLLPAALLRPFRLLRPPRVKRPRTVLAPPSLIKPTDTTLPQPSH